jgi:hypothetical protein
LESSGFHDTGARKKPVGKRKCKIEQAAGSTYTDFVIGRTNNTVVVSAAYALLSTFSPTHHASGPFHASPLSYPQRYDYWDDTDATLIHAFRRLQNGRRV